ncbi:hypothetical protein KC357_g221 [Hortaea werneckii]|nr:hypothetical protein KC357_g221 [Hortaea werneckii]
MRLELERIRLHKHLPRLRLPNHFGPDLLREPLIHMGIILVELLRGGEIRRRFEDVQFLEEGVDGGFAVGGDFAAVEGDAEVGQVVRVGVREGAEVPARAEEDLHDCESGLPVFGFQY